MLYFIGQWDWCKSIGQKAAYKLTVNLTPHMLALQFVLGAPDQNGSFVDANGNKFQFGQTLSKPIPFKLPFFDLISFSKLKDII